MRLQSGPKTNTATQDLPRQSFQHMHLSPNAGEFPGYRFDVPRLIYSQTFTNILIPDILSMRNDMELLSKLLASQKNNPDPQQQVAHDLLRRTVNFAAQVKATQSQSFVAMDNRFQFFDVWSVPSKADEIGTMALWGDPETEDETRVYYIVCHQRSPVVHWRWFNAALGMEIRRESHRWHRTTA